MIPLHGDRRTLGALLIGSLVLLGAGAAGMFLFLGEPRSAATPATAPSAAPDPARPVAAASDVTLTVPAEILARAGIETAPAVRGSSTGGLRIPATVQPHDYRQVVVSSTSAGRVLSVSAELGQAVKRGDPLIELHSPEVADTERAYVSTQAELVFSRQQLTRLERLVQIGAASQQELDGARAQQARLTSELEGARARLLLLGLSPARVGALTGANAINPTVVFLAPIAGTVTRRAANPGQTVDASVELFTIVDLSTVWVVGDVYERDLASVRVGSLVTMTSAAFPGDVLSGRVTYVDSQVAPDSRTARVRVEVANPGGRLRLGMLMEMRVSASPRDAVMVPRPAIQTIDGVDVVYVADPRRPGVFHERSVRLGVASGDMVEVLAGLEAGEPVVTTGSFLVRSERDRANLAAPRPAPAIIVPAPPIRPASSAGRAPKTIDIDVTPDRFAPATINVEANVGVRLRFTRRVEDTCATEVVFPALNIRKPLPVGRAVVVELAPQPAGVLEFACGMNMLKGQLIVR